MIFAHNKNIVKSGRNFDNVADHHDENDLLDVRNAGMSIKSGGDQYFVHTLALKKKFSAEISEMLLNI